MKPLIDTINTVDGQFHLKNKETGELATIVTPKYMNDTQGATRDLQQECIAVLTEAGLAPDAGQAAQLIAAIKAIIKKQSQPLDATLTALASLVGAANKLPYFNGADTAALVDLTQVGRDIIGKADIAAVLTYLGLDIALSAKAPLFSPVLTGNPTGPTARSDNSSEQLATTKFVHNAVAALINASPAALDTLSELAAALGNDANFATTMTNALAGKQAKDTTLTNLSGKDIAGLLQYLGFIGEKTVTGVGYALNYFKIPVNTPTGVVTKIVQYGTANSDGVHDIGVGFPIPFPSAYQTVIVSPNYTAASGVVYTASGTASPSTITIRCNNIATIFWLAIGD
jgi:hypothetical protein